MKDLYGIVYCLPKIQSVSSGDSMEKETKKTELPISGMHCASCAINLEKGLKSTPGVTTSRVNLATGKALVEYDPETVTPADLTKAVEKSGFSVTPESVLVKIGGLHCASCVQVVTKALTGLEGVLSADINLSTERAHITYNPAIVSLTSIRGAITSTGYQYLGTDKDQGGLDEAAQKKDLADQLRRIIIGFGVSIILMVMMYIPSLDMHLLSYIQFIITTPVLFWLGYPIFRAAYGSLRNKTLNMDVMYAMGIGVAYLASVMGTFHIILDMSTLFYETAIMLTAFLMLGRYLEARAKGRTSSAIKALIGLQADSAAVIRDGEEVRVPVEEVMVGDLIQLRPGERIPVDGVISAGSSYIDESMVTGEPLAVLREPGDEVVGGTLVTTGAFQYEATRIGADTMLARIIRLVEEAQGSRPPVQRLADTVVTWFIPAVLTIAILSFTYWFAIRGMDLRFSLQTLIAVLVVACPCALGLATPTAVTVGIGRGAELGILIRNGSVLEVSNRISLALFDKTGTITAGKPVVTDIDSFTGNQALLLSMAASLERLSNHPLGVAITNKAEEQEISYAEVIGFSSVSGMGLSGTIAGGTVLLGNRDYILKTGGVLSESEEEIITNREREGKTTVLIARDNTVLGVISIADMVKPGAETCVRMLHEMGIKTGMVTGDNQVTADAVARSVGIDTVYARVLPEGKDQEVIRVQKSGEVVAFIGDGINDAPALARADTGIAIGSGTDVAIESADVVLVRDDLTGVAAAIQLARTVMSRIRLNLFWAFAYNVLLIPLAAGVLYPTFLFRPEYGALAMAFSSVTIVSLSLLLKRYTPPAAAGRRQKG